MIVIKRLRILFSIILISNFTLSVSASGFLSQNYLFKSSVLNYDLNYRVYTPDINPKNSLFPTLYLTDGQWYINSGDIKNTLDRLIGSKIISPLIVVFVDSRNPYNLKENRRNNEFMCNAKYINFFVNELIPTISHNFPVSLNKKERVIGGLSFGGLNAACFGLSASNSFGGIAMQSPASKKHLKIISNLYNKSPTLPLKIFLSSGSKKDNADAIKKFYQILQSKKYDISFRKNNKGHNWENWRPLIDDLLTTFFSAKP
ncbi:MAG: alpha/beta hydrolase-fold protein [Thalassotalea sp.]|nr:alpha/beta hydrolase-fold protein [Thalassotalea sp.]